MPVVDSDDYHSSISSCDIDENEAIDDGNDAQLQLKSNMRKQKKDYKTKCNLNQPLLGQACNVRVKDGQFFKIPDKFVELGEFQFMHQEGLEEAIA